jgi:hypothetical protein
MSVNFLHVFSAGLKDIWKNPVLFVPNLLSSVLSAALLFLLFAATVLIFFQDFSFDFSSGFEFDMLPNIIEDSFIIIVTFLIYGVFSWLLSLYIHAGLIGMSKEAAESGKTTFSTLFSCGRKYFFRFVSASVLMGLIFLLPISISALILVLLYVFFLTISSKVLLVLLTFAAFVLFLVLAVSILIFYIYLHFAFYSIIADNLSAVQGIRKSVSVFNADKLTVLLFLLILFIFSMVFGIVSAALSLLGAIPTIGIIFIALRFLLRLFKNIILGTVTTVWNTRMYSALADDTLNSSDTA